jgi:hypothetical protein
MPHSKILNVNQAAHYLFGKSNRTFKNKMYRIIQDNKIPYIVLEKTSKNPRKYFTEKILDDWLEKETKKYE